MTPTVCRSNSSHVIYLSSGVSQVQVPPEQLFFLRNLDCSGQLTCFSLKLKNTCGKCEV